MKRINPPHSFRADTHWTWLSRIRQRRDDHRRNRDLLRIIHSCPDYVLRDIGLRS